MGLTHVGIDPGLTGGVAVILPSGAVAFYDTPTFTVTKGKKNHTEFDIQGMVRVLMDIGKCEPLHVTIEKVSAMPGQGVTSMFNFGRGFGLWEGVVAALMVPYDLVHPVRWKKLLMADMSKDKDASRLRACQLYPAAAPSLNLKKHHGRADALLLAHYGSVTYKGPTTQLEQPCELFAQV